MEKLDPNWFAKGLIDAEYKRYVLLSWLQQVGRQFGEERLYPFLAELIGHYSNMRAFRDSREKLQDQFPGELEGLEPEKLRLRYRKLVEDDELMQEIDEIIRFSLPRMEERIDEGKHLYEHIASGLEIEAIGVLPLYRDEGYLLIRAGNSRCIRVFRYSSRIIPHPDENYRAIRTEYLGEFPFGIVNTFESLKLQLIRSQKDLPNPATFRVESLQAFPEKESLIPVVQREFLRTLARIA